MIRKTLSCFIATALALSLAACNSADSQEEPLAAERLEPVSSAESVDEAINSDDVIPDEDEKDNNARPALSAHVENMYAYDTIILGYPNWWGTIPMPVASFLEEYDLSGKIILP